MTLAVAQKSVIHNGSVLTLYPLFSLNLESAIPSLPRHREAVVRCHSFCCIFLNPGFSVTANPNQALYFWTLIFHSFPVVGCTDWCAIAFLLCAFQVFNFFSWCIVHKHFHELSPTTLLWNRRRDHFWENLWPKTPFATAILFKMVNAFLWLKEYVSNRNQIYA